MWYNKLLKTKAKEHYLKSYYWEIAIDNIRYISFQTFLVAYMQIKNDFISWIILFNSVWFQMKKKTEVSQRKAKFQKDVIFTNNINL